MTMAQFGPIDRRRVLLTTSAAALAAAAGPAMAAAADPYVGSSWRKLSDADWKKRLAPPVYNILREEGTERPWSSPLLNEHRKGVFACAGCDLPLFRSDWKFESGTGWPSFYTAIKGSLGEKEDHLLAETRTEYHCARCLGHQGHVFRDGPQPTGLRYCNDGLGLKFVPA
jgi:peptide-methionine (R)-S-oxide reductase